MDGRCDDMCRKVHDLKNLLVEELTIDGIAGSVRISVCKADLMLAEV